MQTYLLPESAKEVTAYWYGSLSEGANRQKGRNRSYSSYSRPPCTNSFSIMLGVRQGGLLAFGYGGECGLDHSETFVELLVRDHKRHQNTNYIIERARRDGD